VRLAHAGAPGDDLTRPTRVYATATDPHHASDRPKLTATPIAARLDVALLDHHGRGAEPAIADEVVTAGEPTLIVWDHGHIPMLAKSFPLDEGVDVPEQWPDDRFDLFWLLVPNPAGRYTLHIQGQELLAGNSDASSG